MKTIFLLLILLLIGGCCYKNWYVVGSDGKQYRVTRITIISDRKLYEDKKEIKED